MILLIDNYDSFSYNLYQLIGSIDSDIRVIRNDSLTIEEIAACSPTAIILSPGPGRPEDAGVCVKLIQTLGSQIPILGVCLGHQAICTAFGATVSYAKKLMHGKQSQVCINQESPLFAGCPKYIPAARYHSLATLEGTLPRELHIIARAEDGEIMAVSHANYAIYGVQFHPESILTPDGEKILKNFLKIAAERKAKHHD